MGVESRISEVTLYARGARVRREVTVVLDGARVKITGLPSAVIDDTVRVEAGGDAVVTALHVGYDAPAPSDAADEDAPEVRAARRRVALADAEVERLDAAIAVLVAAPVAMAAPPRRDEPSPAWAAVVEARHALVGLRAGRELALRDQIAAARRAADEARQAHAAVLDRERRASSARGPRLHELRKHVELEVAGTGSTTLVLEYQVAAARWAPSYVARIDGDAVRVELRAVIAQATGEDWTGVALRLSTAEPERFGALPELTAQRIGRRQTEPARPGFRPAPVGAGELYLDYVRAFTADTFDDEPTGSLALDAQTWDEGSSHSKQAFALGEVTAVGPPPTTYPPPSVPAASYAAAPDYGPPGMPPRPAMGMLQRQAPPAAGGAPSFARTMAMPTVAMRARRGPVDGVAGEVVVAAQGFAAIDQLARSRSPSASPPPPGPPAPRLDYGNLRMAPPGSRVRGTLVTAQRDRRTAALDSDVAAAIARIDVLTLPAGCATDWPHTYDYAFAGDGTVDVRADGAWHSIAVCARPSTAKLRHVAVPREQPDVFRLAEIANPFDGPLLPGPIDVYDRGSFLVTSAVGQTPPGAAVKIGLGVDPQIKLARNTEYSEEATGVLRGGLRLHHAITIELDNHADRAIDLEVRERIPVTREGDDEVEVVLGKVDPPWERWTPDPEAPGQPRLRGGFRWRLTVPAHSKRALRAGYDVKITSKLELVGGNRRES